MKTVFKRTMVTAALVLTGMLSVSASFAQADSTTGNGALNWRALIPLYAQERETPVVNNTTQVTQNVTQQVTQVVQPNTRQASGSGQGQTTAAAWANCNSNETLLGGGGSCTDFAGLVAVGSSEPSGNSWVIGCQSLNYNYVYATAYAICSAN